MTAASDPSHAHSAPEPARSIGWPARILWALGAAGSLLVGAVLLGTFSLPFAAAKDLADHLSKDGNLESLTRTQFQNLSLYARLVGLALLAAGGLALGLRRRSRAAVQTGLDWMQDLGRRLRTDTARLGADLRRNLPEPRTLLALAGITLFAFFFRLALLSRPMFHDEAYTYVEFAAQPFRVLISDYHLPNNHVLHTILVHFVTRLVGMQPWAVRLPSFTAGILLVPATYLLARRLYGKAAGFLSAALVAACPVLIDFATNARGYSQEALITLLAFTAGSYVLRRKNLAAWMLIGVLGGLGFYTIPVMLYPFGMLLTWLGLSALAGDISPEYRSRLQFFQYLAAAGAGALILTAAFYFPIIRSSGLRAITANATVIPLSWQAFHETIPGRLMETWQSWSTRLPDLGIAVSLALAASLVFHWKISASRVPLQLAAALALPAILIAQRGNPWAKIWTFLVPIAIIWASAGILAPFEVLKSRGRGPRRLAGWMAGAGAAAVLVGGLVQMVNFTPHLTAMGEDERAVLLLKDRLQGDDVLVVREPNDAVFWYYTQLHGIPSRFIRAIKTRPFSRAFVVVNASVGQTPENVIEARGPDYGFVDFSTARPIAAYGQITVYEIGAYADRVKRAYGLP